MTTTMNFTTALNRAQRQADETGRTWFVIGNGCGVYWTTDVLEIIPMSGARVRPLVTVVPETATKETT